MELVHNKKRNKKHNRYHDDSSDNYNIYASCFRYNPKERAETGKHAFLMV